MISCPLELATVLTDRLMSISMSTMMMMMLVFNCRVYMVMPLASTDVGHLIEVKKKQKRKLVDVEIREILTVFAVFRNSFCSSTIYSRVTYGK